MDNRLEKLEEIVKKIMGNEFAHGYPHVERVMRYANKIIEMEEITVDRELLTIGILLHDVGRIVGEPHAYYSSIIARGLLASMGYSQEFIRRVENIILYHSFSYSRKHGIKPETIEAHVLSDADKLDALGTIGVLRVAYYSCIHGRSLGETIRHFDEKILRLKDILYFESSRRMAEELTRRVKLFRDWLIDEYYNLYGIYPNI